MPSPLIPTEFILGLPPPSTSGISAVELAPSTYIPPCIDDEPPASGVCNEESIQRSQMVFQLYDHAHLHSLSDHYASIPSWQPIRRETDNDIQSYTRDNEYDYNLACLWGEEFSAETKENGIQRINQRLIQLDDRIQQLQRQIDQFKSLLDVNYQMVTHLTQRMAEDFAFEEGN